MARRIKRKLTSDAGVSTSLNGLREINDQGGQYDTVPRSAFFIRETESLVFSDTSGPGSIVESSTSRLIIADGAKRPGW
jgi:hypothetical protein